MQPTTTPPTVPMRSIATLPATTTRPIGRNALVGNTTGNNNTATGSFALRNSIGTKNTAVGEAALLFNSTGDLNIALGDRAGQNLTTGNNNIDTGNAGVAGESGAIRIGTSGTQTKTFVAGINGAAVTGAAVKVNAAGQLGGTLLGAFQGRDQTDGQDERSNSGA